MSENMTSRAEWDAMTDDEKYRSLQLTEQDNAEMRRVLKEIPECPAHGFCLPHFSNWIRTQQGLEPHKSEAMLNFDLAASKLLQSGYFS